MAGTVRPASCELRHTRARAENTEAKRHYTEVERAGVCGP
jgi:hypothetical protein